MDVKKVFAIICTITLFVSIYFMRFQILENSSKLMWNLKKEEVITSKQAQPQNATLTTSIGQSTEAIPANCTDILTYVFPDKGLQNLFVMDQQFPANQVNFTQQYHNACGFTLLNQTFCATRLWEVTADPGDQVPNIVHVIYDNKNLKTLHVISILSMYWIIKPKYLVYWYIDELPSGDNWNFLYRNLTSDPTRFVFLPFKRITSVYGNQFNFKENSYDIIRMEILIEFGGIYLDLDCLVVKSLKPLLVHSYTVGRENSYGLNSGLSMTRPRNPLHIRWHLLYRFYSKISGWSTMAVILPHVMQRYCPSYFHVEEDSLDRPNWLEMEMIYGKKRVWDWQKKNYAVHLWFRLSKIPQMNFSTVDTEDSMFGDIMRFIMYGKTPLESGVTLGKL